MRFTVRTRSTNIKNVKLLRNNTIEGFDKDPVVVYNGAAVNTINDTSALKDKVYYYRFEITTEAGVSLLPISTHISVSSPELVVVSDDGIVTIGELLSSELYPTAAQMVELIKAGTEDEQVRSSIRANAPAESRWFKSYIEGREYLIPLDDLPLINVASIASASRLSVISRINEHARTFSADVSVGDEVYELQAVPMRIAAVYLSDLHSGTRGALVNNRAAVIGNKNFGSPREDLYKSHMLPTVITDVANRQMRTPYAYTMYVQPTITTSPVTVMTSSTTAMIGVMQTTATQFTTGVPVMFALVKKI